MSASCKDSRPPSLHDKNWARFLSHHICDWVLSQSVLVVTLLNVTHWQSPNPDCPKTWQDKELFPQPLLYLSRAFTQSTPGPRCAAAGSICSRFSVQSTVRKSDSLPLKFPPPITCKQLSKWKYAGINRNDSQHVFLFAPTGFFFHSAKRQRPLGERARIRSQLRG